MNREAPAAIELQEFSLALRHAGEDKVILSSVSLVVPRGGLYLLVGESGSGKSTVLRLMTGLWEPR